MNPYLVKSEGFGRRSAPTHVDRVRQTNTNNADNRAMGISRLLAKTLMGGDYQAEAPIDTRKQSVGVQFSNNANQIRVGSVEDPDVGQFALHRKRQDYNSRHQKRNTYHRRH